MDEFNLSNYFCYYIEDDTTRDIGESLLILVPLHSHTYNFSIWHKLLLSDITSAYVNFTKEEYKGYIGVVTTNPIIGIIRKIIRFQEK